MKGKEPETAENFDEDDYITELIDKEGYSNETARMKARKKKEWFANHTTKIEIDMQALSKTRRR